MKNIVFLYGNADVYELYELYLLIII